MLQITEVPSELHNSRYVSYKSTINSEIPYKNKIAATDEGPATPITA